jgi:hypothetical protein
MKPSFTRRYRRRSKPAKSDGAFFKKESRSEQSFFGEASHDAFFQPAVSNASSQAVQRKCAECEKEDKQVQRAQDKKEEDKKLQRATDKKEDDDKKLMRAPEKKEEDKKLQRATDKKEEDDKKLQRAEDKKEEDKKIQKKEGTAGTGSGASVSSYVNTLGAKGQAMPPAVNHFFASRMGYDFSNVKLHTDKEAAESAKSVNAKAYTIGNHIVFNEAQYNTASGEGKKLLAHELAHVMQNNSDGEHIDRQAETDQLEEHEATPTSGFGTGTQTKNTRHFANCAGVNVQGHTDANYSNSFTVSGASRPNRSCSECGEGDNCVTNTGTIVSTFAANPTVTLPAVPSGLSDCERLAVQNFINTTLRAHELQHLAAFNTYNAVIRTRYTYNGCASGLDAYIQSQHDAVEVARRSAADAQSAALDPFNAAIPCNCPDPAPNSEAGQNE